MDGRTDGRTDGQTELRSQTPCNAERRTVKTKAAVFRRLNQSPSDSISPTLNVVEQVNRNRIKLLGVILQHNFGFDKNIDYRAKPSRARYCQAKLSVRVSVSLRYRDHIGWTSAKIISWLISLTYTLCRPQHNGSIAKGALPNFIRNRIGV